jgi:N-acetylmuramoyl-L-alanine amidase
VVVDIKSFKSYKIFSLKDPFRIVIDVWGAVAEKTPRQQKPNVVLKKNGKLPASALAKQLALGISRIIIDPGHGGRDYGAPGYLKGIHEKDIALQISRRLAKMIRLELKCQVFMTRNSDKFLTLEERTAIANTKSADLFISIHTNSHRDRNVFGIETYFLNLATDDEAIRVAAIENATSTKNISDLQNILFDLVQNAKINESSRLAGHVQGAMISVLKSRRYSRINDKGVKQAPFYVLLGAQMPAVLVETSFISNPRECKRLINPKYQERLCEAIVDGIKKYIRETIPTAYLKTPPDSANNG